MDMLLKIFGIGGNTVVEKEQKPKRKGECGVSNCNAQAKVKIRRGDCSMWVCRDCADELVADHGWEYEILPLGC